MTNLNFPFDNQNIRISSNFGIRNHPKDGVIKFHNGIDIPAPIGTDIKSMSSGIVIYSGIAGGYGNVVVVRNDDGTGTSYLYAHMSKVFVNKGQIIKAGEIFATVGKTGIGTGPHLHLEKINSTGTSIIEKNTSNTSLGIYSDFSIRAPNQQYRLNPLEDLNLAKEVKLDLKINTQNTSSQQAIDLILGKNQATDPNQTKIIDLSDYDKVTINNTETNSYEVKSGDTFNNIADKLIAEGKISSRQDLIDANPDIIDLDIINVGDVINIPLYETKMTFSIAPKASLDNKVFENLTDPSKASLTVSYVDKDGNPLSQDDIDQMILTAQDGNNNDILLLKQNSVFTTLKDGTIATLESVIEMAQTAKEVTVKFVDGYMREVKDLFTTGDGMASLINDVASIIKLTIKVISLKYLQYQEEYK